MNKEVSVSDNPTMTYHLNLRLVFASQSFIVSCSSLFGCPTSKFIVLFHSHCSPIVLGTIGTTPTDQGTDNCLTTWHLGLLASF